MITNTNWIMNMLGQDFISLYTTLLPGIRDRSLIKKRKKQSHGANRLFLLLRHWKKHLCCSHEPIMDKQDIRMMNGRSTSWGNNLVLDQADPRVGECQGGINHAGDSNLDWPQWCIHPCRRQLHMHSKRVAAAANEISADLSWAWQRGAALHGPVAFMWVVCSSILAAAWTCLPNKHLFWVDTKMNGSPSQTNNIKQPRGKKINQTKPNKKTLHEQLFCSLVWCSPASKSQPAHLPPHKRDNNSWPDGREEGEGEGGETDRKNTGERAARTKNRRWCQGQREETLSLTGRTYQV